MIKASFRLILAALAATVALTACTKEITPGQVDTDPKAPQTEGSRIIAVSFAPRSQTKTYLDADGLSPIFKEGDGILLYAESEGTDTPMKVDTCQVKVDSDGKTFITTDLEGELIAFYPVSAVKRVYSDKEDKEVMRVSIPSVQSGRFADANILTGEIDGDCNEVTLEPETSLLRFYVDKSIRVKSIKVTSPSNYINDDENSPTVTTVTAPEGKTLDEVTDDPGKRICYVAVAYEANIDSVKFEIETETQDKVEKITKVNGKFLRGKMYNVFIPYYIKVKVSDSPETYQKWAYCNIGAFLPEEPGLYFAWGDTTGYRWDAEKKQFEGGHSFTWENAPFNNDSTAFNADYFNTVRAEVCPNGVLALKYDAANANWGGKWRMPTEEEFRTMYNATYFGWDDTDKGCYVYVPNPISDAGKCSNGEGSYTKSNALLFFPAAGGGTGEGLNNKGSWGYYRASSLFSDHKGFADYLYFRKDFNSTYPQDPYFRCSGLSVRPICDDTISEDQPPL